MLELTVIYLSHFCDILNDSSFFLFLSLFLFYLNLFIKRGILSVLTHGLIKFKLADLELIPHPLVPAPKDWDYRHGLLLSAPRLPPAPPNTLTHFKKLSRVA